MVTKPDDLRIGDTERDAVTAALHDHFAAGRLDREELEERLGGALTSKTRGDLKKLTADLPGPNGLPEAERSRPGPPWAQGHAPWAHGHMSLADYGVPRHVARHLEGHGHPAHRRRRGPSPGLPLMVIAFVLLAIMAGPGQPVLAAIQLMLLILIIGSVARSFRARSR